MSPETIASLCIDVAADYFGVTRQAILSRARPAKLCWPRHVAMTAAWELSGLSTTKLAPIFNRKDHVTVIHAHKVVTANVDFHRRINYEAVCATVLTKSRKVA